MRVAPTLATGLATVLNLPSFGSFFLGKSMSYVSQRRVRIHVLAAATALALSSMAVGTAFAAGRVELGGLQPAGQYDRFIVKYHAGSRERANPAVMQASLTDAARAVAATKGRSLNVKRQRRLAIGADFVKANRKLDRVEAESLMRQIAVNPAVEYVEIDSLMKPTLTPNDPRFVDQWGFTDADAGIRANLAWDVVTGSGIVVAVLDTGITAHSDLNDNLVAGYDFIIDTAVSNDGNGRDSDPSDPGDAVGGGQSSWHGTHVTGTVAAETNNSVGVAGTAFGAKVMPVRVLGVGGGYLSDIADAIVWSSGGVVGGVPTLPAADAAKVINMSLGGSGVCGTTYQTAIDSAVSRGTTVVVAAGNSNSDVANFRPASCNNVVAVASVTSSSNRSSFSNFGPKIDVSAPGSGIWSTLNSGVSTPGTEAYASYNGTSMASPHAAGTVALVQSRRLALSLPLFTPAEAEALLKSTAYALSGTCTGGCGAGIVNAKAAVDAASAPPGNLPPVANFTFTVSGLTANFTDASTDTDGTIASRSWTFGDGGTSTATNPSRTYAAGGTYNVTLTVTDNNGAVHSTTKSVTVVSPGVETYRNNIKYKIPDMGMVESRITIAGRSGNAPMNAQVSVNITHPRSGDVTIDLLAPDGTLRQLKLASPINSGNNVIATYTVDLSSEALNGIWKLRVRDVLASDAGHLNRWSVTF